jgi:hypothetical protein
MPVSTRMSRGRSLEEAWRNYVVIVVVAREFVTGCVKSPV